MITKRKPNDIAMIFQEPMTSLNPVFSCGDQVMEDWNEENLERIVTVKKMSSRLHKYF